MATTSQNEALQQAREALEAQAKILERLAKAPLIHGSVIKVGKKRLTIAKGAGEILDVEKAEFDLLPGDGVLIDPEGGQILEKSIPLNTGEPVTILRVDGDRAEVSVNGSNKLVFVGIHTKLKEGDEVLLNSSGHVVTHTVQFSKPRFAVSHETKVTWDSIGGQREAKAAMREAVELPFKSPEIYKAYNKRPMKGVLLSGPPGCIDGDALVAVNRAGKGFTLPLRDLVAKANGAPSRMGKDWDLTIPTMVRCFYNGEFRLRKLVGAYQKGIKPVMKLSLSDGKNDKEVRLTPDHEVLTDKGWVAAEKLTVGTVVLTNGVEVQPEQVGYNRWLDEKGYWWVATGLKNHPFFEGRKLDSYDMPEHRLTVEAGLNGYTLPEWLLVIKLGTFREVDVFLTPDQLVHHKDEDSTNNDPSNLEIVTHAEHAQAHEFRKHLPIFQAKEMIVVHCDYDGETEVFDITVEEAHNFTANGIVVHNCGKTMLGKAAATAISELCGVDKSGFLYIKGPEVLDPYVGVSEATVRKIFIKAKEHKLAHGSPAVVFVDEADAILGKRGMHHSFMEKTIVPAFLTEMDGMEESGALIILATNRPDTLDPAVVRDGRIDRKVAVSRPDRHDSRDIFKLYLGNVPIAKGLSIQELAEMAAEALFHENRALYQLTLRTRDEVAVPLSALVSGSMIAGIVDKAVSFALHRDIEAGLRKPTGVTYKDVMSGIVQTHRENLNIDHAEIIADVTAGREVIHTRRIHHVAEAA